MSSRRHADLIPTTPLLVLPPHNWIIVASLSLELLLSLIFHLVKSADESAIYWCLLALFLLILLIEDNQQLLIAS